MTVISPFIKCKKLHSSKPFRIPVGQREVLTNASRTKCIIQLLFLSEWPTGSDVQAEEGEKAIAFLEEVQIG